MEDKSKAPEQVTPEVIATQPRAEPRLGSLVVSLYEGRDFCLPGLKQTFRSHQQNPHSTGEGSGEAGHLGSSEHSNIPAPYTATPGRISPKDLPYILLDFDQVQVVVNVVSGTVKDPVWAGDDTPCEFDVCQAAELVVRLYLPNPNSVPGSERSEDILLGVTRINPCFEEACEYGETDRGRHERSLGQLGVELMEVQGGTGKIRIGVKYIENETCALSIGDFNLLVVGSGSFGEFMKVQKKDTKRIYAMKPIRKRRISQLETANSLAEQSVLFQIRNPFIVPLKFSFRSPEKLYLVLAFPNGGGLFSHLQRDQRFDIDRSRLYAAELLCELKCLHSFNGITRGLKPEKIHLDYFGHIALHDLSLCQPDSKDEHHKGGTSKYLALELLLGQDYLKVVDWWTLGSLLYEMLTGLPPFYDENTEEMNRKILTELLHFPGPEIVPPSAEDILTKLLNRNPEHHNTRDYSDAGIDALPTENVRYRQTGDIKC